MACNEPLVNWSRREYFVSVKIKIEEFLHIFPDIIARLVDLHVFKPYEKKSMTLFSINKVKLQENSFHCKEFRELRIKFQFSLYRPYFPFPTYHDFLGFCNTNNS